MDGQINMDYLASQCAQEIVKITDTRNLKALETLATKTLGVLQEQGIYAMVLFLLSRTKKDEKTISKNIYIPLCKMLEKIPNFSHNPDMCKEETPSVNVLEQYSTITRNLDSLLLVRSFYEKVLIYTRYGAKAAQTEYKEETNELDSV